MLQVIKIKIFDFVLYNHKSDQFAVGSSILEEADTYYSEAKPPNAATYYTSLYNPLFVGFGSYNPDSLVDKGFKAVYTAIG